KIFTKSNPNYFQFPDNRSKFKAPMPVLLSQLANFLKLSKQKSAPKTGKEPCAREGFFSISERGTLYSSDTYQNTTTVDSSLSLEASVHRHSWSIILDRQV